MDDDEKHINIADIIFLIATLVIAGSLARISWDINEIRAEVVSGEIRSK